MAKKTNKTEEQFANVEENLSKAGIYVVNNQKKLIILSSILIGLIAALVILNKYYTIKSFWPLKIYSLETINKSNEDLSKLEFYFENEHYTQALNGDTLITPNGLKTKKGSDSVMISVAERNLKEINATYPYTEAANLSHYYTAICQINLGSLSDSSEYFEEALLSLGKFETDDKIISTIATGLKGDANMELGKTVQALVFYKSAATDYVNDLTTPYFMMKQAHIHEINEDFSSALEIYSLIKSNYPESKEGGNIDKYISSAFNR